MKDYRVKIKVTNNHILSMIDFYEYKSVNEFCNKNNLHPGLVGKYVNLKVSPLCANGDLKKGAEYICTALKVSPDMLWPEEMEAVLQRNTAYVELDLSEIKGIHSDSSPETDLISQETNKLINQCLDNLTYRESKILSMKFGFGDYEPSIRSTIASEFDISISRVMQIEERALRKLRHPSISDDLKTTVFDT
jgi:RNA polymerase sigma factor (sigma-70 family)